MFVRAIVLAACGLLLAVQPAEAAKRRAPAAKAADLSKSLVPLYPGVVGEYLQIPGAPSPGTPAGLATATFLRLRFAADGASPKPANAVIVAMPGFASTPAHWLNLGAQLVQKASQKTCAGAPCRLEIWIVQRRGANLADTAGARLARSQGQPVVALDYYFDRVLGYDADRPGRFPMQPSNELVGIGHSTWRPLRQADAPFMADWGFATYAGDVDRMIALIRETSGAKAIFLAGHSQGGGFVANYAGRRQADGKRGVDKLAGLIFLDGGPSAGADKPFADADRTAYFARVHALREGKSPVFTEAGGLLGNISGPAAAAVTMVTSTYVALSDPNSESIFGPAASRASAAAPAGDAFLRAIRLTYLARAGMTFDTDPIPGAGLQIPAITFLGQGLGRLDFTPRAGSEAMCDPYTPKPSLPGAPPVGAGIEAIKCVPLPAQLDHDHVYGWVEGGAGSTTDVGRAALWLASQGYAPARSNIRPVTFARASGAPLTLDAAVMPAANFYASERYDFDMNVLGRFRTVRINEDGVDLDIDKTAVANIPVYVARQATTAKANNPFPGVGDYTEINKAGTWQSDAAKALTPLDPTINAALYHHTDFIGADDSAAGKAKPGEPGASVVADTLVDWVLKRARGKAVTPTPTSLGVVDIY